MTFPEYNSGVIRSLNGVKVGDKFVTIHRWHDEYIIVECEKVTPKQCIIGGYKYRIKDAQGIGESQWNCVRSLLNATPERIKEINDFIRFRELVNFLKYYDFKELDIDKLEKIYEILKPEGEPK